MTKFSSRVGPLVDVGIPLACKNLSQTELVRPVIFLVGFVPRRPKNKRQRPVSPDDVEIVHGKILFSPIARRSDDCLMFAHHLLEVFDFLETDVILPFAKIHECARVSSVLGNHHLDWAVWIDLRDRDVLTASSDSQSHCNRCNSRPRNCIDAHPIPQARYSATVVHERYYKPCHSVILSEAKNPGSLLDRSPQRKYRPEMFRFAQHDSHPGNSP